MKILQALQVNPGNRLRITGTLLDVANIVEDDLSGEIVTAGNPFVATLSQTPVNVAHVEGYVRGQRVTNGSSFTVATDGTVTWLVTAPYGIEASDSVIFRYEAFV